MYKNSSNFLLLFVFLISILLPSGDGGRGMSAAEALFVILLQM